MQHDFSLKFWCYIELTKWINKLAYKIHTAHKPIYVNYSFRELPKCGLVYYILASPNQESLKVGGGYRVYIVTRGHMSKPLPHIFFYHTDLVCVLQHGS